MDVQDYKGEIKIIDEKEITQYNLKKLKQNYIIADSFMTVDFLESRPVGNVAGGSHASGDPLGTLKYGFDFAFVGEGEKSLFRFLNGEPTRGIAFKFEGKYYFTGRLLPKELIKLDDFPSFPWWRKMFGYIEIQRGCKFGCKYCETPFLHGKPRFRSLESIEEHVKALVKAGKRDVRFITPNAFEHSDIIEIINLKEKYPNIRLFIGSFPSEVRPEYVNEDLLKEMKRKVANREIIVGAQSGSEKILKLMGRGHSVEDVKEAVELIVKYGFTPSVDFIIGLPFEEEEDYQKTMELIRFIVERGGKIHMHFFMPLPGTPWESLEIKVPPKEILKEFERLIGKGKLYGDWQKQIEISLKTRQFYREKRIYGLRSFKHMEILNI